MFENDISIEDKNNFKEYLRIYAYDLIHLDNSLLKNIETKLFYFPLKYYVKYFALSCNTYFDKLYNKYQDLCKYNRNNNSVNYSYKIIILKEKLKAKTGVVGVNDILLKKINELENLGKNKQEELLYYIDFYLDTVLTNENDFKSIKFKEDINNIQMIDINKTILNYLKLAITICIITDEEKCK